MPISSSFLNDYISRIASIDVYKVTIFDFVQSSEYDEENQPFLLDPLYAIEVRTCFDVEMTAVRYST
jgi:hypothetical protein